MIEAWTLPGLLLERHTYESGPPGALPLHDHDVYQLGFSPEFGGEYRYRRARHAVPVGALTIIHPGEPHAAHDLTDRACTVTFPMMYVDTDRVCEAVGSGGADRTAGALPYFEPVVIDVELAEIFRRCFHAGISGDAMAMDSLLVRFLHLWYERYGERAVTTWPSAHGADRVRLAREYLHAHAHQQHLSLATLANVAKLSRYHFLRVFKAEVGMSPHQYLTQLRVWRAARLLAEGCSISDAALTVGFADQSHLTRHFKRHTGFTPGKYVSRSAA